LLFGTGGRLKERTSARDSIFNNSFGPLRLRVQRIRCNQEERIVLFAARQE